MEELVTVKVMTNEEQEQFISARELHEILEIKTKYKDWFPRMTEYGFTEGEDFNSLIFEQVQMEGNREVRRMVTDHHIKLDMAKEIAMIQRSEKGKQIRLYLLEIEKAWNSPEQIMARALKLAERTINSLSSKIESQTVIIEEQKKEIIHKEDVIVGLVGDIDLATKRQRINQIMRMCGRGYQERYGLLYKEFELKYHCNLKRRMESEEAKAMKPKVKNKMDYIDRSMGMIPELYEICCKLFEQDVQYLRTEWESKCGF